MHAWPRVTPLQKTRAESWAPSSKSLWCLGPLFLWGWFNRIDIFVCVESVQWGSLWCWLFLFLIHWYEVEKQLFTNVFRKKNKFHSVHGGTQALRNYTEGSLLLWAECGLLVSESIDATALWGHWTGPHSRVLTRGNAEQPDFHLCATCSSLIVFPAQY